MMFGITPSEYREMVEKLRACRDDDRPVEALLEYLASRCSTKSELMEMIATRLNLVESIYSWLHNDRHLAQLNEVKRKIPTTRSLYGRVTEALSFVEVPRERFTHPIAMKLLQFRNELTKMMQERKAAAAQQSSLGQKDLVSATSGAAAAVGAASTSALSSVKTMGAAFILHSASNTANPDAIAASMPSSFSFKAAVSSNANPRSQLCKLREDAVGHKNTLHRLLLSVIGDEELNSLKVTMQSLQSTYDSMVDVSAKLSGYEHSCKSVLAVLRGALALMSGPVWSIRTSSDTTRSASAIGETKTETETDVLMKEEKEAEKEAEKEVEKEKEVDFKAELTRVLQAVRVVVAIVSSHVDTLPSTDMAAPTGQATTAGKKRPTKKLRFD